MLTEALQGPVIDFHIFILMTIKDIPPNSHYLEAPSLSFAFLPVSLLLHTISLSLSLSPSLCFASRSLTVGHIDGGHVAGGCDEVQETYARLHQTDHAANSKQPLQPNLGFLNVVHYIQQSKEQLVPHAHEKQHRPGCVVQP